MGDERGGGGVADAHFTQPQHIAAACGVVAHQFGATRQGGGARCATHGGGVDVVGGAPGLLGIDQARARAEIVGHAGIDDRQGPAVLAAEDVDGRAAGKKIFHHLPGDFLRVGGDARFGRAMVASEHQHLWLPQLGRQALLDQADLQRYLLQCAEGTERLGLAVDLVLQGGRQRRVGTGNGE